MCTRNVRSMYQHGHPPRWPRTWILMNSARARHKVNESCDVTRCYYVPPFASESVISRYDWGLFICCTHLSVRHILSRWSSRFNSHWKSGIEEVAMMWGHMWEWYRSRQFWWEQNCWLLGTATTRKWAGDHVERALHGNSIDRAGPLAKWKVFWWWV